MTGLKASRDKLLAEVDRQSREIERLLYHNAALEQVNYPLLFLYTAGIVGTFAPCQNGFLCWLCAESNSDVGSFDAAVHCAVHGDELHYRQVSYSLHTAVLQHPADNVSFQVLSAAVGHGSDETERCKVGG